MGSVYLLMFQVEGFASLPRSLQFLAYLPIYAAISIAAALILHYLVEKPSLYLKDRYVYRPLHASSMELCTPGQSRRQR